MINDLQMVKPLRYTRQVCGHLGCICVLLLAPVMVSAQMPAVDSLEKAIELRVHGDLNNSIEMLLRLKEDDQENIRLNLELVISYLKSQQYTRAEEVVESIFTLSPAMKDNKKLQKLTAMIELAKKHQQGTAQTKAQIPQHETSAPHLFKGELTLYKGFEELTSQFSYLEITEFEDYYQVERKSDQQTSKYYYSAARIKGEYRYTPSESFSLFGRPTYTFVSNRFTWFTKRTDTLFDVRFGYASIDSSWYVIQPKYWSLNAKLKGKWHSYQGDNSLRELLADINFSTLFHGARIKLGVSHNDNTLDQSYADNVLAENYYIVNRKSSLFTPYVGVSYRFSSDFLWTLAYRQRNIHSPNDLLEGRINSYSSTFKFDVSDTFEVHLSYAHDDLRYDIYDITGCFDVEAFSCLNSGELKRTFTFGSGYFLTDNWQLGLNAMYMDKKQDNDFGQDQWKRLEGFVRYRF